jgi:hypothetical protein
MIIDEDKMQPTLKGWEQNKSKWTVEGEQSSTLTKGEINYFLRKETTVVEIEIYYISNVFIKEKCNNNSNL